MDALVMINLLLKLIIKYLHMICDPCQHEIFNCDENHEEPLWL